MTVQHSFPGNINIVSNYRGRIQLYAPAYADKEFTEFKKFSLCVCDSDDQAEINDAMIYCGLAAQVFNDGTFTPEGNTLVDEAIAEYNFQVNGVAG